MTKHPALVAMERLAVEDLTEPGTFKPWGEIARPFQRADVEDFLRKNGPPWNWWDRPRGASKTQDAALLVLSLLATDQPAWTTTHVFARDAEQAGILFDKIAHLTAEFPTLVVTGQEITNPATGARIIVEPADAASVLGQTPWLVVVDELLGWPVTRGHQALWGNILSGLGKRPDARLLVISSAGDPATPFYKAFETAKATPQDWHVSRLPGPSPLMDPAAVERARRNLPASLFSWHYLNEPAAPDDALATAEEAAAVFAGAPARRPYDPAQQYLVTADLSETNDRTVLMVTHMLEGDVLVVDALTVWKPTRARPIKFAEVRAALEAVSDEYGGAAIKMDKSRGEQMIQDLREAGRLVDPVPFTLESNTQMALALQRLLRARTVRGLDHPDLRDELATVFVQARGDGKLKIEHHSGRHNDVTVTLAMAAQHWLAQPGRGRAGFTSNAVAMLTAPVVTRDRSSLPLAVARTQRARQAHARATLGRMIRRRL